MLLSYLGKYRFIVFPPFFWNWVFRHERLLEWKIRYLPFQLGRLCKPNLFPSLPFCAFMSLPMISMLYLGKYQAREDIHFITVIGGTIAIDNHCREVAIKCKPIFGWVFFLLLSDFKIWGLRNIPMVPIAALTMFFYADAETNIHSLPVSW